MGEPTTSGTWRRFALRLGLALFSAVLLGAYAWYPAAALLPYVALIPWVVLYTDDRNPRVSWWYFVLTSWIAFMLQCPQPFKLTWYAAPAIALPPSVPWWIFAPVLQRVHRLRLPRALTVPVVWVSVEWMRATFAVGHFDLYRIGYSQARFPILVQVADVTGVYGVSFLVAAVNGLLADGIFALRDGGWSLKALRTRSLAREFALVTLAFVLFAAYGGMRLASAKEEPGPRVALVQPCTSHEPGKAIGDFLAEVLLTQKQIPSGAADLVVWPENAVLDNIRRDGIYLDDISWLAQTKNAHFLVGGMDWPLNRPGKKMNGAFLVDPTGKLVGEYKKQILFPFTEYVPADESIARWWPAFHKIYRLMIRKSWGAAARAVPGDGMTLFHLPWNGGDIPFAALICSENTYPPVPAEAGRLGARFFVNVTSEGNLGGPVQEQLMRISELRAIENRIAYVRVGNTGISGVIDATGRPKSVVRGEHGRTTLEPGVLVDRIPLSPGGTTLYARSHDAFAKACVAAAAGLFLWAFAPAKRRIALAAMIAIAVVAAGACAAAPNSGRSPVAANNALARGRAFYKRGRPAAALAEFVRACADPVACRTAIAYAEECFKNTREIEHAIDFFGGIAARYPELAPEAKGSRGVFLERAGDLVEAEKEYRESAAASPTPRVCQLLAELLLRREDLEGAVQVAREGIRVAPDDPEMSALYARSLRRAGRLDEAQRILDTALASHADSAPVLAELGRVRLARGDVSGADAALRSAAAADPALIESRFLIARIAVRAGRLDEARERLQEIERIQAAAAGVR